MGPQQEEKESQHIASSAWLSQQICPVKQQVPCFPQQLPLQHIDVQQLSVMSGQQIPLHERPDGQSRSLGCLLLKTIFSKAAVFSPWCAEGNDWASQRSPKAATSSKIAATFTKVMRISPKVTPQRLLEALAGGLG